MAGLSAILVVFGRKIPSTPLTLFVSLAMFNEPRGY